MVLAGFAVSLGSEKAGDVQPWRISVMRGWISLSKG
jgi:hypothetical protein